MRRGERSYHKAVAARLQRSRERQISCQHNRYTQIDRFMCTFENAWREYYQIPITLQYAHGWYYLLGRRHRHQEMEAMLADLLARLQELECPNPDNEETDDGRTAAQP